MKLGDGILSRPNVATLAASPFADNCRKHNSIQQDLPITVTLAWLLAVERSIDGPPIFMFFNRIMRLRLVKNRLNAKVFHNKVDKFNIIVFSRLKVAIEVTTSTGDHRDIWVRVLPCPLLKPVTSSMAIKHLTPKIIRATLGTTC